MLLLLNYQLQYLFLKYKEWYTDNELITVGANVNPYSAGPVNFSWWYSGIINVDYGQDIIINTGDYGLGSHNFKLVATDILGNSDIIYFNILVFSEISIQNYPFYEASQQPLHLILLKLNTHLRCQP